MNICILDAMHKCYNLLLNEQQQDKALFFVPRRKNDERLNNGYLFIGNDEYLQISFWLGGDWKEKTHNIAFVVKHNGDVYIELSATYNDEHKKYLKKLADVICEKTNYPFKSTSKGKWFFYMNDINIDAENGDFYLEHLKHFIKNEKIIIDNFLRENESWLTFPDKKFNEKYVLPLTNVAKYAPDKIELKYLGSEYTSSVKEGKKIQIYTYKYERNAKNRNNAIEYWKSMNSGRLVCSVCGFDFETVYGSIGSGFSEVHHNKPLSQSKGNEMSIDFKKDLDCLCSNCHRMIHRLKNQAPTVENLKKQINNKSGK